MLYKFNQNLKWFEIHHIKENLDSSKCEKLKEIFCRYSLRWKSLKGIYLSKVKNIYKKNFKYGDT